MGTLKNSDGKETCLEWADKSQNFGFEVRGKICMNQWMDSTNGKEVKPLPKRKIKHLLNCLKIINYMIIITNN